MSQARWAWTEYRQGSLPPLRSFSHFQPRLSASRTGNVQLPSAAQLAKESERGPCVTWESGHGSGFWGEGSNAMECPWEYGSISGALKPLYPVTSQCVSCSFQLKRSFRLCFSATLRSGGKAAGRGLEGEEPSTSGQEGGVVLSWASPTSAIWHHLPHFYHTLIHLEYNLLYCNLFLKT